MSPALTLLLLCSLIAAACSEQDPEVAGGERPLFCLPDTLQQGRAVRIYYDRQHPKAAYPGYDSLLALISCETDSGFFSWRVGLKQDSDAGGLLLGEFLIPRDAISFDVEVGPFGSYMPKESARTIVFAGAQPARRSLAYKIRTARSLEEAMEWFEEDRHLYPEQMERWLHLINMKVFQEFPAADVQKDVRALDSIVRLKQVTDPRIRIDAHAALALGCAYAGSWPESLEHLFAIENAWQEYAKPRKELSGFPLHALGCICDALRKHYKDSLNTEGIHKTVFRKIVHLGAGFHHFHIIEKLMMDFDSEFIVGHPDTYRLLLDSLEQQIENGYTASLRQSTDVLALGARIALNVLQDGMYINTAYRFAEICRSIPYLPNPANEAVTIVPMYVDQNLIMRTIANYHLEHGDTLAAQDALRVVLRNPVDMLSKGSANYAAEGLFRSFLQQGATDSATKYCAQMVLLDNSDADEAVADLNALRTAQSLPGMTKQQLSERYAANAPPARLISGSIETLQGPLDVSKAEQPIILLITQRDCSACEQFLPPAAELLCENIDCNNVVVISRDEPGYLRSRYGTKVRIAALTPDLEMRLDIRAAPAVKVLKKGRVVHESTGAGPNTGEILLSYCR